MEKALSQCFKCYDQAVSINNLQLSCFLGMLLLPAGIVLDVLAYPKSLQVLFELRLLGSAAIGVFWLLVRTELGRRQYKALSTAAPLIPAYFLSVMIFETGGAESSYYATLNVLLLLSAFALHWDFRQSAYAYTAVLGIYLLACFAANPSFSGKEAAVLANNLYFLVMTGIIVVASSGYFSRLRYREFALLYELDIRTEKLRSLEPQLSNSEPAIAISQSSTIEEPTVEVTEHRIEKCPLYILRWFRWFCGKDKREIVDLLESDLLRDRREMREEGRSTLFISLVVAWNVFASIAGILVDSVSKFASKILPIRELFR